MESTRLWKTGSKFYFSFKKATLLPLLWFILGLGSFILTQVVRFLLIYKQVFALQFCCPFPVTLHEVKVEVCLEMRQEQSKGKHGERSCSSSQADTVRTCLGSQTPPASVPAPHPTQNHGPLFTVLTLQCHDYWSRVSANIRVQQCDGPEENSQQNTCWYLLTS